MPDQRLTLTLDPALAGRLGEAAAATGLSASDLVLRCVRDHLDGIAAYSRVSDELGLIRMSIVELSGLVGEALAEPDEKAVSEFCRYKPDKGSRGT